MVLALEIDGDRYHKLRSVRDRDGLRQNHLERIGWTFHRIWASDWSRAADLQADRLEKRWCEVLQGTDESGTTDEPGEVELQESLPSRGPRPPVPRGPRIDQCSEEQLDLIAEWVLSDDLPLDIETRLQQMKETLGFERNGPRIVQRLRDAIERARRRH